MTMLIKGNPIPENVAEAITVFFDTKDQTEIDVQDVLYWLLLRESDRMKAEKEIDELLKEEDDTPKL